MSYAQLFAQKLESKDGPSRQNDRKKDGDRRTDNRTDRKRERDDSRRRDSRSEPDKKRPYDEGSKRPNSRACERNKSRYQGKIPEGWIGCPEHGELIHDFILPIKVPLHPNYDNHVKKYGKLWKMKDLFQLEQKFDKKVLFFFFERMFQLTFRSVL